MIENFKLKVFRVVADMLNYRRAADELHLTQRCSSYQPYAWLCTVGEPGGKSMSAR